MVVTYITVFDQKTRIILLHSLVGESIKNTSFSAISYFEELMRKLNFGSATSSLKPLLNLNEYRVPSVIWWLYLGISIPIEGFKSMNSMKWSHPRHFSLCYLGIQVFDALECQHLIWRNSDAFPVCMLCNAICCNC